jgi:hypothetical protein
MKKIPPLVRYKYHVLKIGTVSMWTEPVFVNLLRSPGIDFQPGGIDSWVLGWHTISLCHCTGYTHSVTKGGWSANKFRKSADLNILLDLRTFRKCGSLRICDLWTRSFVMFAYFKLQQVLTNVLYCITPSFNVVHKKIGLQRRRLVLFWEVYWFNICGLSMNICRFAICGLAHLRNLRTYKQPLNLICTVYNLYIHSPHSHPKNPSECLTKHNLQSLIYFFLQIYVRPKNNSRHSSLMDSLFGRRLVFM